MRGVSRRWARLAWHGAVLGLIVFAAWKFIDLDEFSSALAGLHWAWLAALLGIATADRFLMAGKWLQLLRHVNSAATFPAVLSAYYQVAFVQRVVPSSLTGDVLRAMLISRRFHGTSGVLASMVVEKLMAMVASAFVALSGLAVALFHQLDSEHWWLLALIPVMLAVLLAGLALSHHRPLAARVLRLVPARTRPSLERVYELYASFSAAPGLLSLHFFYCVVEQVLTVLLWLFAAIAIGVDASPVTLFAALSVAHCLRKYAIILEGWLFGEFTLVLIVALFGVPQSEALAFSLLAHVCGTVATLPGAVLFSRSAVRLADLKRYARRSPVPEADTGHPEPVRKP
jgi:glycosyltransferase 2 family protein